MIGGNQEHVKFHCWHRYDAVQLAEFLANEGVWFEFIPDVDDTYVIGVQPYLEPAVTNRLVQCHACFERVADG